MSACCPTNRPPHLRRPRNYAPGSRHPYSTILFQSNLPRAKVATDAKRSTRGCFLTTDRPDDHGWISPPFRGSRPWSSVQSVLNPVRRQPTASAHRTRVSGRCRKGVEKEISMNSPRQQRFRLSGGSELSFVTAGDPAKTALLLLHGFPSSSRAFREVIPSLAQAAYVIAPDLPGYGQSEPLPSTSFPALGEAVNELLRYLDVKRRFLYLHDYGAPVALHLAMNEPARVAGLIIQNANAHRSGFGPQWADTLAYWSEPTPENEAAAAAHLTLEGTRAQYTADVPNDVVARIKGEPWLEDWRIMNLPERMAVSRALIADYGNYVARFEAIAHYLATWQPPSLMTWGRHDAFFALAETQSWLRDLPRMEGHILDAGHFLLETHAGPASALILDFIRRA